MYDPVGMVEITFKSEIFIVFEECIKYVTLNKRAVGQCTPDCRRISVIK